MSKFTEKYIQKDGKIKIVVYTGFACYETNLVVKEKHITDHFNDGEPYDRKTHVFYVDPSDLSAGDKLVFEYKTKLKFLKFFHHVFEYNPVFEDADKLYDEYNSRITVNSSKTEKVDDGVVYGEYDCTDKAGAPVKLFTLDVDMKNASLYVGTPDDGYRNTEVKAKIPEMIDAAVKNGVNVIAAANADFFDMFGDCHPSGLCVKNGRVVANADSKRPFIGVKKDGTAVVSDLNECPELINDLDQAAAGLQMIVKDGKVYQWDELETFSFTRHPRTAAGVRKDGSVILLVADGRIPEYSNGASLVDLAEILIGMGADRAINMDGGGSSIVITKDENGFNVRNTPADLVRPRAKLIRKEFNGLLVVKK